MIAVFKMVKIHGVNEGFSIIFPFPYLIWFRKSQPTPTSITKDHSITITDVLDALAATGNPFRCTC